MGVQRDTKESTKISPRGKSSSSMGTAAPGSKTGINDAYVNTR